MDWNTIENVTLSVVMLVAGWALRERSAKLDHRRGLETLEHQQGIVREAQKVAAVGRTLEFLLRVHHVLTVERILAEEGPRLVQKVGSDNDEFKLLRGWLHSLGAHIVGSPEEFEAHLDQIAESRPLLAHRLRTFPYVLQLEGLLENLVQQIDQVQDVDLGSAPRTVADALAKKVIPELEDALVELAAAHTDDTKDRIAEYLKAPFQFAGQAAPDTDVLEWILVQLETGAIRFGH